VGSKDPMTLAINGIGAAANTGAALISFGLLATCGTKMSTAEPNKNYNPPQKSIILFMVALSSFSIFFAVVIGMMNGKIVEMLIAGVVIGAIFLLAGWYREYYHRPRYVEVQKDGILLINRYSPTKKITYEQIVALGSFGSKRGGGIVPAKGENYMVTSEIAMRFREAYINKVGVPPREWDGRQNARDYRRSIGMK
jgi:hypothetical protein